MENMMTTQGLIFMTVAWTIVISLTSYSIFKVLKGSKKFHEEED